MPTDIFVPLAVWLVKRTVRILLLVAAIALLLAPANTAGAEERNQCGCYRDDTGTCYCEKKAKCGCPGECEPRGCEEQRDRALQREIDAETKKVQQPPRSRAGSDDRDPATQLARTETRRPPAAAPHKLTAAQAKQLGKLLDLYLQDRPDARSKTVEGLRDDLSGTR